MRSGFFRVQQDQVQDSEFKIDNSPILYGLKMLTRIPEQELYRMVVDGNLHKAELGWVGYESRGEGCLRAVFKGLSVAVANLSNKSLSSGLIRDLHKACSEGVEKVNAAPGQTNADLDACSGNAGCFGGFGLSKNTASADGLLELLNFMNSIKRESDDPRLVYGVSMIKYKTPFNSINELRSIASRDESRKPSSAYSEDDLFKRAQWIYESMKKSATFAYFTLADTDNLILEQIVKSYNEQISIAVDDSERLRVIVSHIAMFERLHPFMDGNIRTFAVCLLTYLLLQNGFGPAMLYDPNHFDAYSTDELVKEVQDGMNNFKAMVEDGETVFFEFNSNDIPVLMQEEMTQIVADFRSVVQEEYLRLSEAQAEEPDGTFLINSTGI